MASFTRNIRRINKTFAGFDTYQPAIPMTTIMQACEDEGLVVLQEDGTRWAGIFCGAEGEATFSLGDLNEVRNATLLSDCDDPSFKETRHTLRMTWYKMTSGRYELILYVS